MMSAELDEDYLEYQAGPRPCVGICHLLRLQVPLPPLHGTAVVLQGLTTRAPDRAPPCIGKCQHRR